MIWDSPQCDLPPRTQTANEVVVLTRGGIFFYLKKQRVRRRAGLHSFMHGRTFLVPPVETLRGWPKEWTGVNHMHSMTMRFDRLR